MLSELLPIGDFLQIPERFSAWNTSIPYRSPRPDYLFFKYDDKIVEVSGTTSVVFNALYPASSTTGSKDWDTGLMASGRLWERDASGKWVRSSTSVDLFSPSGGFVYCDSVYNERTAMWIWSPQRNPVYQDVANTEAEVVAGSSDLSIETWTQGTWEVIWEKLN